jgi:predicted PurR-regulated permease PerM
MDILRNLFGNVTAGIIRLLVTVGIIAAIGFFLVKPALDTTEKISKEANTSFEKSFGGSDDSLNDINKTIEAVNHQVEREINRSFHQAKRAGGHDPDQLITCIQRAHQNVVKIQRCTNRY